MIFSFQVPVQTTDISPSVASGDAPPDGANVSQKDTNLPLEGVHVSQSEHNANLPPEEVSVSQSAHDINLPPEGVNDLQSKHLPSEGVSVSQSEHDANLPPEGEVHESSPENIAQELENDDVFIHLKSGEKGMKTKIYFCM